jgi:hypothetical protein
MRKALVALAVTGLAALVSAPVQADAHQLAFEDVTPALLPPLMPRMLKITMSQDTPPFTPVTIYFAPTGAPRAPWSFGSVLPGENILPVPAPWTSGSFTTSFDPERDVGYDPGFNN